MALSIYDVQPVATVTGQVFIVGEQQFLMLASGDDIALSVVENLPNSGATLTPIDRCATFRDAEYVAVDYVNAKSNG